jgi:two-component system osmolarity sensor histidine kinase EnvZ
MKLVPRTMLVRTFLLVCLLMSVSVASWLTLFALAEREPRARQLAQLTVSVVNLTRAALISADPVKRHGLLRELAEREGVRLYPAEPGDMLQALPDQPFFRIMRDAARAQLGPNTRFASRVNGEQGIWTRFSINEEETKAGPQTATHTPSGEDDFWVMLPSERAERDFSWHWLAWGGASLALALLVTWLIVSRVTLPLRALARSALEVGRGRHPQALAERGSIELQQLAEAFNRMSEDLRRNEAERAEVLAGISHDLRTPLARLRLEAEMSIADHAARDAVSADIEQMDDIIAQFLDYARGEGDEAAELTETADLNALVAQVAGIQRPNATPPKTDLGELPPTRIHPRALSRALANLIENARKYGDTAGDAATEVRTRSKNGEILIDVLDRGPGIPESETERLKRPFTRLETARSNASGTGLGLAIVERVARLHEGKLELLPREGGGLIARLRLPISH